MPDASPTSRSTSSHSTCTGGTPRPSCSARKKHLGVVGESVDHPEQGEQTGGSELGIPCSRTGCRAPRAGVVAHESVEDAAGDGAQARVVADRDRRSAREPGASGLLLERARRCRGSGSGRSPCRRRRRSRCVAARERDAESHRGALAEVSRAAGRSGSRAGGRRPRARRFKCRRSSRRRPRSPRCRSTPEFLEHRSRAARSRWRGGGLVDRRG